MPEALRLMLKFWQVAKGLMVSFTVTPTGTVKLLPPASVTVNCAVLLPIIMKWLPRLVVLSKPAFVHWLAKVGKPEAGLVVTPLMMLDLRRRFWSTVIIGAIPQAAPGSSPILPKMSMIWVPELLTNTKASSPL